MRFASTCFFMAASTASLNAEPTASGSSASIACVTVESVSTIKPTLPCSARNALIAPGRSLSVDTGCLKNSDMMRPLESSVMYVGTLPWAKTVEK